MIWFFINGKHIFDDYSRDEMSVYAAQASFFIILAALPFLMVLLALIQVIPMIHEADLLEFLMDVVPANLRGLVLYALESIHSDSPIALISVTALAAVWSSSKGMLGIERGLNRIYGVTVQRNYLLRRLICSIYTIFFTIMCVLSLVLLVFGGMLQNQIFTWFPAFARFRFLVSPGRGVLTFGVLFLFFVAVYTVLPYRKLTVKSQLPGALFSSAGWALFSVAFSVYFKYFGHMAVTYGSLTAAILMMLWLYVCICILFLGAEINHFLLLRSKKEVGES